MDDVQGSLVAWVGYRQGGCGDKVRRHGLLGPPWVHGSSPGFGREAINLAGDRAWEGAGLKLKHFNSSLGSDGFPPGPLA